MKKLPIVSAIERMAERKGVKQLMLGKSGIVRTRAAILRLIECENQRGVPCERIFLAGFSRGGAIAYATALTHGERLACAINLPADTRTGCIGGRCSQCRPASLRRPRYGGRCGRPCPRHPRPRPGAGPRPPAGMARIPESALGVHRGDHRHRQLAPGAHGGDRLRIAVAPSIRLP